MNPSLSPNPMRPYLDILPRVNVHPRPVHTMTLSEGLARVSGKDERAYSARCDCGWGRVVLSPLTRKIGTEVHRLHVEDTLGGTLEVRGGR